MKRKTLKHLPADLVAGSVSGFLATGPMTVAMKLLHKYLVFYDQHSPPPRKITMRIAKKARIPIPLFKRRARKRLTVLSHYGYGAATGALYPVWSKEIPIHPIYKGTLYGVFVWAASYLGWLPAAGLWNPKRESSGRRFTMIASHIIWGASLGLIHSGLQQQVKQLRKSRGSYYAIPQRT